NKTARDRLRGPLPMAGALFSFTDFYVSMLDLGQRYSLPTGTVELRAFTHGLMPRTVPAMMEAFVCDWQERGVDAWNDVPNHWLPDSGERVGWWTLPEYLGDRFIAPLLNAPEGSCILQPNVHSIVQALLSCPELDLRGRRVLSTASEFPSVIHTLQRWQDVYNYEIDVVEPLDSGFADREAILDAITPDTRLVILSHVGFTTGEQLEPAFLRDVANRVHRHGGFLAVDGFHATGTLVIDVEDIDADVYFGGLLKHGSASSGNAYLYVRPGLDLRPRASGWFGDEQPFAFDRSPADHPSVPRRFMSGTPAVASMYHAVEGLRILLDVGREAVRQDSLEKTERCLSHARALSLTVRSPIAPQQRAAMVILEVDRADLLCAHLKTRGVYTDSRKQRYLRMAPYVWNTLDDIDRAFNVIGEALRSGEYLGVGRVERGGPVT
ncbi:MAG: aminotransferase class V-fold PLP-dependent enzyme, partial [Bacteroidota bacterium]